MKLEDYLAKYTKEIKVKDSLSEDGESTIVVSKSTNCYLTIKGNEKESIISILASHNITKVESTITDNGNVCPVANIGYSEDEELWYGWSHRAICSFGVGSECKKGYSCYVPSCKEDYIENAIDFWRDDDHENIHAENITEKGFEIVWTYAKDIPNEKLRGQEGGIEVRFPKKYGRGEWTAKTIEDARQMAIDCAEGLS